MKQLAKTVGNLAIFGKTVGNFSKGSVKLFFNVLGISIKIKKLELKFRCDTRLTPKRIFYLRTCTHPALRKARRVALSNPCLCPLILAVCKIAKKNNLGIWIILSRILAFLMRLVMHAFFITNISVLNAISNACPFSDILCTYSLSSHT